jgi:hypothetical protein
MPKRNASDEQRRACPQPRAPCGFRRRALETRLMRITRTASERVRYGMDSPRRVNQLLRTKLEANEPRRRNASAKRQGVRPGRRRNSESCAGGGIALAVSLATDGDVEIVCLRQRRRSSPGMANELHRRLRAKTSRGYADHVVQTVTENCRTLKFESQGFERE